MTLKKLQDLGASKADAHALINSISKHKTHVSPEKIWQTLSQKILHKKIPFEVHAYLFKNIFLKSPNTLAPVWSPTQNDIEFSNIHVFMKDLNIKTYEDFYEWSIQNKTEFLQKSIQTLGIIFKKKYKTLMNTQNGIEKVTWLDGARLNIAESCFQAEENTPAIRYQTVEGTFDDWTYKDLKKRCAQIVGGLKKLNIQPGDCVGICMPMHAESVAIYLAIIAHGAIALTIADSFSAEEIKTRLDIGNVKYLFTQESIVRNQKEIPLYDKVSTLISVTNIVLAAKNKLCKNDIHWQDFLTKETELQFASCSPEDTCTILFSSGTTGAPKAIPWSHNTPIKCAIDAFFHQDIHVNDTLCWPTNLGWMMGPWLVFSALMNKSCIALSDAVPTSSAFCLFVQDAKVTMLGVVPSIVKAWRLKKCAENIDWSSIRLLSSTGECSNPQDMFYLMYLADYKPVIEYCGGTEVGGGYISGCVVKPSIPGTFSTPALGSSWILRDENHRSSTQGEVYFQPPTFGLSTKLLNYDHHKIYFADIIADKEHTLLRRHGDYIEQLAEGYFRAHGRIDDSMNLGGIKVSSQQIEEILSEEPFITELAAISIPPLDGGPEQLIIYACSSKKLNIKEVLFNMQQCLKKKLNPLFKIQNIVFINKLPRTASNKIMRRVLRNRYKSPKFDPNNFKE